MRYEQNQFNEELKVKIQHLEQVLTPYLSKVVEEFQPSFSKQNLVIEAEIERNGGDLFSPGSSSVLTIGISEKDGELIDLFMMDLWICECKFFGLVVSKALPFSKVYGEILSLSVDEAKDHMIEYLNESVRELIEEV